MPGRGEDSSRAKALAEDALDDLRLNVLKAEIRAAGPSAALFATTRYRIEMDRRALAIALPRTITSAPRRRRPSTGSACPIHGARSDDRRIINGLGRGLSDRRAVIMSWQAIRESLDLLRRRQDPRMN